MIVYILSIRFFPTLRSDNLFVIFTLFLCFSLSITRIMSDNLEGYSFCEIEIDRMIEDDDVQEEKRTDEEMSLDSEIKRKVPTRAPNVVWQHFEKIFDDNGIHIHTKCNYCNQKYKVKCSTTTLNDHWKGKHSKIQPKGTGSIEMAFNNPQKLKGNGYLDSLSKLVDWVITECQSFRVVDSSFFREFIKSLNPEFQVPSRQTLRKKIDDKYTTYKSCIIKMFQVKMFYLFILFI